MTHDTKPTRAQLVDSIDKWLCENGELELDGPFIVVIHEPNLGDEPHEDYAFDDTVYIDHLRFNDETGQTELAEYGLWCDDECTEAAYEYTLDNLDTHDLNKIFNLLNYISQCQPISNTSK